MRADRRSVNIDNSVSQGSIDAVASMIEAMLWSSVGIKAGGAGAASSASASGSNQLEIEKSPQKKGSITIQRSGSVMSEGGKDSPAKQLARLRLETSWVL